MKNTQATKEKSLSELIRYRKYLEYSGSDEKTTEYIDKKIANLQNEKTR